MCALELNFPRAQFELASHAVVLRRLVLPPPQIRAELIVLLGHNFERNKSFQRRQGIEAEQNSSFIQAERTQACRQLSLKTFRLHLF